MSEKTESSHHSSSPTLFPQSDQEQVLDDVDPLDEENIRLQRLWDSRMEDKGGNGPPNRKTFALLLTWDPRIDELDVSDEVNDLEEVFRDTYNYTVIKKCIIPGKTAQHQVQKYLADFVLEFNDENTLLIVYYAGHGSAGEHPGHLVLEGEKIPSKMKSSKKNKILWHEAEHAIKDTDADVFVIFDCCYAGNLIMEGGRGNSTPRNFEFMGATDHNSITSIPGKESFTSALIWAFREFAKKRALFTIGDLQNKIRQEAPFFPKKQVPVISSRYLKPGPIRTHLVLGIDPKDGEADETICPAKEEKPALIKETVDLRICFVKHPNDEDIDSLASAFKDWIEDRRFTAQRVQWLRLRENPTPERLVQQFARQWQKRTFGYKKLGKPDLRISTAAHSPYDNALLTPPRTLFGDQATDLRGVGIGLELMESPDSVTSMTAFSESPKTGKCYEELKLFSVSHHDRQALMIESKGDQEGLFYHIFGILKIARDLLRQPEFRWISMVVILSIACALLRLSLRRNLQFMIVPVRIFNITRN